MSLLGEDADNQDNGPKEWANEIVQMADLLVLAECCDVANGMVNGSG